MNWFRYEKKIMRQLGFEPQPGSGSDWLKKEDGENEYFIAQLKATEGKSISIAEQAIKDLKYHAQISHKVPVFVSALVGRQIMVSIPADHLDEFIEKMMEMKNADSD